ncbi:MAG: TetR/AcrR family transcriptional regulator [Candidatus Sericytochromatia bacterium]
MSHSSANLPSEGLRARKKRETHQHIVKVALRLFLENGYEATTLDTIAAAAGISRRTIFAYFKSKDDIVLTLQAAAWDSMLSELRCVPPATPPLEAVCSQLVRYLAPYESEQVRASDRLMRASETLSARKQATYAAQEEALFATLTQIWPDPAERLRLRLVAMVSMGALRLALDMWGTDQQGRTAASFLEKLFAQLKSISQPR